MPNPMTLNEIQIVIPLIDAGIKATGLQLFQNGGGYTLQSALEKLQHMADEATKAAEATKAENANG